MENQLNRLTARNPWASVYTAARSVLGLLLQARGVQPNGVAKFRKFVKLLQAHGSYFNLGAVIYSAMSRAWGITGHTDATRPEEGTVWVAWISLLLSLAQPRLETNSGCRKSGKKGVVFNTPRGAMLAKRFVAPQSTSWVFVVLYIEQFFFLRCWGFLCKLHPRFR